MLTHVSLVFVFSVFEFGGLGVLALLSDLRLLFVCLLIEQSS